MKLVAIDIYTDYCRIKKDIPSYRLGQHYCNVLGLKDTTINDVDLFTLSKDKLADICFYNLCEYNCWDVFDLPVFGDYDLTTIKPF